MTHRFRLFQIIRARLGAVKAMDAEDADRRALSRTVRAAILAFAGVVAAGVLSSCDLIEGPIPVQLMGAQIVLGNDGLGSKNASIHYTLRNVSSKDISAVHISFYMYDTSNMPAPYGKSNYFDITFGATITAGSQVTAATSLDSAFWYPPPVGLIANQFHIYKVEFTDGSSWTDWLGEYVYPYNITSVQGS